MRLHRAFSIATKTNQPTTQTKTKTQTKNFRREIKKQLKILSLPSVNQTWEHLGSSVLGKVWMSLDSRDSTQTVGNILPAPQGCWFLNLLASLNCYSWTGKVSNWGTKSVILGLCSRCLVTMWCCFSVNYLFLRCMFNWLVKGSLLPHLPPQKIILQRENSVSLVVPDM